MTNKSPFAAALKANLAPAIILWTGAVLLLVLYYRAAPVHEALNSLAVLKDKYGLLFVMPSQIFAAAIVPFFFQQLQRGDHKRTRGRDIPYLCVFWAVEGALVSQFYALQARIFGSGIDLVTILLKTGADMLISNPLFWTPLIVSVMAFKDAGYSVGKWKADVDATWYRRRVWPLILACWVVWTPAIAVLYALPLPLQFPFQSVVLCFWALILVVMTGHEPAGPVAE